MPQTVKLKRSTTASAVPTGLVTGEIAINEADGRIFYRNTSGNSTEFVSRIADGSRGDITVSSNGSSWSITAGAVVTADLADASVTDVKIADVAASKLTGTVPTARLGSGTASSSTYLRGDGVWATVSGGGGGTDTSFNPFLLGGM